MADVAGDLQVGEAEKAEVLEMRLFEGEHREDKGRLKSLNGPKGGCGVPEHRARSTE